MKKSTIILTMSIIAGFIFASASVSADAIQTSTASVGFVVAPQDKPVKVIKIDGQTYLRNYENYTLIIDKYNQDGTTSESVKHNGDYNSVKINFSKSATYHITILNGPDDVQN